MGGGWSGTEEEEETEKGTEGETGTEKGTREGGGKAAECKGLSVRADGVMSRDKTRSRWP